MWDAQVLLLAFAAIAEDGQSSTERRRDEPRPPFPDASFWSNEQGASQLWKLTDADIPSVSTGIRSLLHCSAFKLELTTLYFHMLSSKNAPVRYNPRVFMGV
jgi:hypothetical protein